MKGLDASVLHVMNEICKIVRTIFGCQFFGPTQRGVAWTSVAATGRHRQIIIQ